MGKKERILMAEKKMIRTGTDADREPQFHPFARGIFLVTKPNPSRILSEEDYLAINLLAQKELCAASREFGQAQKHWSTLPNTEVRQLSNLGTEAEDLSHVPAAEEWIRSFASLEGLVYIFQTEGEIDLRTRERRKPFPVIGFSLSGGLDFLEDLKDRDCVQYRIFYAFAE